MFPWFKKRRELDKQIAEDMAKAEELRARLDKMGKDIEAIQKSCDETDKLFDSVMGEGAAEKLRMRNTLKVVK